MKPKIIFVINTLGRGGAERVLTTLANHFDEQIFRVIIVCLNQEAPFYPLSSGIKVVYLLSRKDEVNVFDRIWYAGLTYQKLLMLLIKEKPKCVISFMTSANLWTGLTCTMVNIPFIVSERTTPDHTINQFNYFLKKLSFILYNKSKSIVIPSKGIEDCIRKNKHFKKLNNFNIIKNPINPFSAPSQKKVHSKKFILGVGSLLYVKGFDRLIEAYSKIVNPEIDLIIVGEGNEREHLTRQIKNLNLTNRVKLIGPKGEVQEYYHQAELFVLPSRNEGYPNVLIEAMSFGCACVAMDCEFGPSEIIENGVNGLLVEENDINKLASAMNDVLCNRFLKEKIAQNAKLVNETNSLENISAKWEQLILNPS